MNEIFISIFELIFQDNEDEDTEIEYGKEIQEYHDASDDDKETKVFNRRETKDKDETDSSEQLLPCLTEDMTNVKPDSDVTNVKTDNDNLSLLTELGLADTREDFGDFQNGLFDDFIPKPNKGTDDVFDKLLCDLNIGK